MFDAQITAALVAAFFWCWLQAAGFEIIVLGWRGDRSRL